MDELDFLCAEFENKGTVNDSEIKDVVVEKVQIKDLMDSFVEELDGDELDGVYAYEDIENNITKKEKKPETPEDIGACFDGLDGDFDIVDALLEAHGDNDAELAAAEKLLGMEQIKTEKSQRVARPKPSDKIKHDDADNDLASFKTLTKDIPQGTCFMCSKDILQSEEIVWALGKAWHKPHFCCGQCGKELDHKDTLNYKIKNTKPYCIDDFYTLFGNTCYGCQKVIKQPNYHLINDNYYHNGCLQCFYKGCGKIFLSESEYNIDQGSKEIYCYKHLLKIQGRLCSFCYEEIKGKYIGCEEFKFHEDHYRCVDCKKHLAGEMVQMKGETLHCTACYKP